MTDTFDAQAIFANLAEKERIKGHHSPEGRAIRTLSRALNGWSSGILSSGDVVVLCNQAIEDWLHARVKPSPWPGRSVDSLVPQALREQLLTPAEAEKILTIYHARVNFSDATEAEAADALEFCIDLIDKRW